MSKSSTDKKKFGKTSIEYQESNDINNIIPDTFLCWIAPKKEKFHIGYFSGPNKSQIVQARCFIERRLIQMNVHPNIPICIFPTLIKPNGNLPGTLSDDNYPLGWSNEYTKMFECYFKGIYLKPEEKPSATTISTKEDILNAISELQRQFIGFQMAIQNLQDITNKLQ